jgi:hypothetical protein
MAAAGEGVHVVERPDERRPGWQTAKEPPIVQKSGDPVKIVDFCVRQRLGEQITADDAIVGEEFEPRGNGLGVGTLFAGEARVIAATLNALRGRLGPRDCGDSRVVADAVSYMHTRRSAYP